MWHSVQAQFGFPEIRQLDIRQPEAIRLIRRNPGAWMHWIRARQILGNNESFEPYTQNLYVRRVLSGEFVQVRKVRRRSWRQNASIWEGREAGKLEMLKRKIGGRNPSSAKCFREKSHIVFIGFLYFTNQTMPQVKSLHHWVSI